MSGLRSRNRGKRGEREAAAHIAWLWNVRARRGRQYAGDPSAPDVVIQGAPQLWIEVKLRESLNVASTFERVAKDCGSEPASARLTSDPCDDVVYTGFEPVPLLLHRRNRGEWLLTLRVSDLLLVRELLRDAAKDPKEVRA